MESQPPGGVHDPLVRTFKDGDSRLARMVAQPVLAFARWEASSGIALLLSTAAALIWANVAWSSYDAFWHHPIELVIGGTGVGDGWTIFPDKFNLQYLVNDGLMAVFFFVVGLEVKRAISRGGELNSVRKAALPAVAALGGMIVPALIYVAFNAGGDGSSGWAIPMATDIAFAVGVLALLGSRVHASLKLFLLMLAIVDDIGAITIIAVFYSDNIQLNWLLAAVGGLALVRVAQQLRIWWYPVYLAIGVVVWYCALKSGIHATIAGVALGFMTPARALVSRPVAVDSAHDLELDPSPQQLRMTAFVLRESTPLTEQLEHLLHPLTALVFVPMFAFANAGVELTGEAFTDIFSSTVSIGIILGLVLGNPIGIVGFTFIATRFGLPLPEGIKWSQFFGMALTAGIGFTVSFFVASLAFPEGAAAEAAKIGILVASAIAATVALIVLNRTCRAPVGASGSWDAVLARNREAD